MKNRLFDVPILFIIFRRKDIVLKVIEVISKVRPKKLYISQDGPRTNEEKQEVLETRRAVLSKINWKCDLTVWTHNKNLGLRKHISQALDRFFEEVEEGIILEEDCLPNLSFFSFCKQMLKLYRNNEKVMLISGDNFLSKSRQKRKGYYFSKYVHIWGWATWKRAWRNYDVEMKDWLKYEGTNKLDKYFDTWLEKIFRKILFRAVYKGKIETWAYPFVYHVWKNGGLSIVPNVNLISNIGFGKDAVHTKDINDLKSNLPTQDIDLRSVGVKKKVVRNITNDDYERRFVLRINLINVFKYWIYFEILKR